MFRNAVTRGVEIKILTNSLASTDNLEAFSSYQANRSELLKTGVSIVGLHAKSMLIDQKTTIIGTFNLDPRSANLNTECFVIVNSQKITKGVLEGMEKEFLP
jgi:putative cardiolipin synthase